MNLLTFSNNNMPFLTTITITNAILTAYCACGQHPQCPKGTLTAIGRPPIQGRTVAVSRQIPLGSDITITLNRNKRRATSSASCPRFLSSQAVVRFKAEDRFNRRFEPTDNIKRVDIFFGTNHNAAVQFGVQRGTVTYTIYGRP